MHHSLRTLVQGLRSRQYSCHCPSKLRTLSARHVRTMTSQGRGAFIVFEGTDRCGKSTQSQMLVDKLRQMNVPVELWRFPDRTCKSTGHIINSYLAKDIELTDEAVHLLFSANRWEKRDEILRKLSKGVTLVVDRYAYSGVAYSAAKKRPNMTVDWCKAADVGLPAPDRVLFMKLSPEASAKRGGYGGERYEKQAFQTAVMGAFEQLAEPNWRIIDADQSIEAVHQLVMSEALPVITDASAQTQCTVPRLWGEAVVLPPPGNTPISPAKQQQQQAVTEAPAPSAKHQSDAQPAKASDTHTVVDQQTE